MGDIPPPSGAFLEGYVFASKDGNGFNVSIVSLRVNV